MWYLYPSMVALDATGEVLRSGVGAVYAESDTTGATPLDMRDVNMLTIGEIKINGMGITEAFFVEVPECVWRSGAFAVPLSSSKGMRAAAEEAAQAAATSASSANEAAAKAMRLPRAAAQGAPAWWGKFTNSTAPTIAEGVVEGDLGLRLP